MKKKIEFEFNREYGRDVLFPVRGLPVGKRYRAVCRIERIEELKPCPFCGGNCGGVADRGPDYNLRFYVVCECCGGEGPSDPSEADAIAAWNRRADDES